MPGRLSTPTNAARGVVVVLSGFPRRSETFALAELHALDQAGQLLSVFATKPGDGLAPQPGAERFVSRVTVLPPGNVDTQAGAIVRHLQGHQPLAVHGYFAHHPAAVAARAAAVLGVPYGFSVHALDARRVPADELRRRAAAAACVVACNVDAQREIARLGVMPCLVPHGVDLERFAATPRRVGGPFEVLAVGRLVPKKGFDVLIEALALAGQPWTVRIVGDGPEGAALRDRARALDVASRLTFHGGCTHSALPALYAAAQAVAVPSIVDAAGDRDGLPNVLLEALASARPVVATGAGAIASAIVDGHTGRLVAAGDARALAAALDSLALNTALADRLAGGGRILVETRYDVRACAARFSATLAEAYAA